MRNATANSFLAQAEPHGPEIKLTSTSYDVPLYHSFLPTTMYKPLDVGHSPSEPFTDYSRWRLLVKDGGRHTWHYLNTDEECAKWPQNSIDKFWLGMETVREGFLPCCLPADDSLSRTSLNSRPLRAPWRQLATVTRSTRTYKLMMAIGQANMADPCSSCQVSS